MLLILVPVLAPNESLQPTLHRSVSQAAGKACHLPPSPLQRG